jgi:hypothetical protein
MMCGCVHHSIYASFPVCKEMQSLILPAKKAHRLLESYIFMIVEDCARPSMLLSRQHANLHQIHAVPYDSRNSHLYPCLHIKDDAVIKNKLEFGNKFRCHLSVSMPA